MLDEHKLLTKGTGGYRAATTGAVTDRVLLDVAARYHTETGNRCIAVSAQEIDKRFNSDDRLLATLKYDGEGVFIYYEAGATPAAAFVFNAPSGRVRLGFPALDRLAERLASQKVKRVLLRGELYLAGEISGKRVGVSEVVRASFSGQPDDIAALRLAIYDLIMLDGKDCRNAPDFTTTWDQLGNLAGTDPSAGFHRAEGAIIPEKQVGVYFAETTGSGQEGIVLRRLTRMEMFKVKPLLTFDAAIIGYVEGDIEGQTVITSLLTAMNYPEGKDGKTGWQVFARVGSGLSDQARRELLDQLSPLKIESPLAMTDSDGRTVHFIQPRHIAELEAADVVTASRQDRANTTQLLLWENGKWTFSHMAACPRAMFPIFSKLRPDKEISSGGARLTQLIPQAAAIPAPPAADARTSRITRREVYTKESKGEVMVRKLVVVETTGDPDSFPWSVFWTDYSPKRKDPLKVSTATALSATRAEALAAEFLASGIVKGWVKKE